MERLDASGWSAATEHVYSHPSWWAPLIAEIPRGSHIVELGAGIGMTALSLIEADMEYKFSLIDFSKELLERAWGRLKSSGMPFDVTLYHADVLECERYPDSDVVFSSGLLEHFTEDEIVGILEKSASAASRVISLVPNAACKPYTNWKADKEANGTWEYGFEQPYETMRPFFEKAGLKVVREYSVGLNFPVDDTGQKYLLLTVGERE